MWISRFFCKTPVEKLGILATETALLLTGAK